jgi:hypothetical protein
MCEDESATSPVEDSFLKKNKKILEMDCCFFCFSDEPVMNNGNGKHTDASRGKYSMMGDESFKVKMMDTPCESCFPCVRRRPQSFAKLKVGCT